MESKTEFSDGTSLAIKLKSDIDPTKIIFDYMEGISKAEDRVPIIARLKEKRTKAESVEEYEQISAQIDKWNALPSTVDVTNQFILTVGKGWDLLDNETKEPKPFDELGVKGLHLTRKVKIAQQLMKDLGFDAEELTDPKEQSVTL